MRAYWRLILQKYSDSVISCLIIFVNYGAQFSKHYPRWSTGYDSALSQPRTGFDSPAGNSFLPLRCPVDAVPRE